MIVDLTISNFKSFKDEQVFSLLAEKGLSYHSESVAILDTEDDIKVLRSAAILGANASGKSNLLNAFRAIQFLGCHSSSLEDGDKIPCYEPYLLSSKTSKSPIHMELEFQTLGLRYLYSVSYNSERILNERLDIYRVGEYKTVRANLYSRPESGWKEVKFGPYLKGGKKKYAFFNNCTYLAKAGNSADAPKILRDAYNYLRSQFFSRPSERHELIGWKDDVSVVNTASKLLASFDTGITSIEIRDRDDFDLPDFHESVPEEFRKRFIDNQRKEVLFNHLSEDGERIAFKRAFESMGTRHLLRLIPFVIEVLKKGHVMIVDELDASLHPHMAELVIKIFNNDKVNRNGAQLIFATHNTALISPNIMRRDQVWFTEKSSNSSSLFSLDEYDKKFVRHNSPYNRWYEEGRFGATPNIDYSAVFKLLEFE